MISVLLPTLNDAPRLAAVLSPLVPASLEGLVRELIIIDLGSDDDTTEIADDAGAVLFKAGSDPDAALAGAMESAKGPWLLMLGRGVVLEPGWEAAARSHIEARKSPAAFKLRRDGLVGALFGGREGGALLARKDVLITRARFGGGDGRFDLRLGRAHRLEAYGRRV
jgi:glycosyltransferase involved in cell wall biosynthesis